MAEGFFSICFVTLASYQFGLFFSIDSGQPTLSHQQLFSSLGTLAPKSQKNNIKFTRHAISSLPILKLFG